MPAHQGGTVTHNHGMHLDESRHYSVQRGSYVVLDNFVILLASAQPQISQPQISRSVQILPLSSMQMTLTHVN
jgi:hypothetical protein